MQISRMFAVTSVFVFCWDFWVNLVSLSTPLSINIFFANFKLHILMIRDADELCHPTIKSYKNHRFRKQI